MAFQLSFLHDSGRVELSINELVLVGFGGRNSAHVEAHIAELALQGMKPPPKTPCLDQVNPALLTQHGEIFVYGDDTVPEVEFVLFASGGQQFVTVGNDQCDLEVESVLSAEKGKNICMKSLAQEAWMLNNVADHWDDLELQLLCNGVMLQKGSVSELLLPKSLFDLVAQDLGANHNGRVFFSGTIPLLAKIPPAPYDLAISLSDSKHGRTIRHTFSVQRLGPLHEVEKSVDRPSARSR